jgi:hypothetical protein
MFEQLSVAADIGMACIAKGTVVPKEWKLDHDYPSFYWVTRA